VNTIKVVDVVGPLPPHDWGVMLLETSGKMFPMWCRQIDAEAISLWRAEKSSLPYAFMSEVLDTVGFPITHANLVEREGDLCCELYFECRNSDKPCRKPVENASVGVLAAIAAGKPVYADFDVSKLSDMTSAYHVVKSSFQQTWPLPPVSSTASLMVLSDFLDGCRKVFAHAKR
jgi:hypothetical protein